MKKLAITLGILMYSVALSAQIRYYDSLFQEVDKTTEVYTSKGNVNLAMDIFQPRNDQNQLRPVLLYVHGGGFQGGRRDEPTQIAFCEDFAKMGYVTATMSYTFVRKGLGFSCETPAHEKVETFLLTARDVSRATRYLVTHHERLGIDTSQIILLGSSAGAEAILHAAYWKETFADESGRILSDSFKYAGVVSMAGAIVSTDWITQESAIPTQLFHGTCDNLVPYGHASHHYCDQSEAGFLMLHGARSISEHLAEIGKPYYLVTGCYGRHEWNITPIQFYQNKIRDFLYLDILQGKSRQTHEIISFDTVDPCESYNSFDFCNE